MSAPFLLCAVPSVFNALKRHGQNANLFLVLQQRLRLLYGLFLNVAL